jgi:MFS family permease
LCRYAPLTPSDIHCEQEIWSEGCGKVYCATLFKAEQEAAAAMSIPYLIAAMISPILGKLVDFYGFRAVVVAVSPSLLFVVHTLLALTRASAFYVLVLQGIAYASYAAVVWPSIPLIVEEKFTGKKKFFLTNK